MMELVNAKNANQANLARKGTIRDKARLTVCQRLDSKTDSQFLITDNAGKDIKKTVLSQQFRKRRRSGLVPDGFKQYQARLKGKKPRASFLAKTEDKPKRKKFK